MELALEQLFIELAKQRAIVNRILEQVEELKNEQRSRRS